MSSLTMKATWPEKLPLLRPPADDQGYGRIFGRAYPGHGALRDHAPAADPLRVLPANGPERAVPPDHGRPGNGERQLDDSGDPAHRGRRTDTPAETHGPARLDVDADGGKLHSLLGA